MSLPGFWSFLSLPLLRLSLACGRSGWGGGGPPASGGPQGGVGLGVDKVEREGVKLKGKRTTGKTAGSPVRVPPDDEGKEKETEPERVRLKLRPVSHQDAIAELESDGQSFHVYLDEDSGKVEIAFKRSDGSVGIIEPIVP